MKVSVDISPEHTEPYAVIYTSQMTDEIQRLLEVFGNSESPITALLNEEAVEPCHFQDVVEDYLTDFEV